jgi:antirestriction protein ArdC
MTETTPTNQRSVLYDNITGAIVRAIEDGAKGGAYRMPWNRIALRHRSVEDRPYRGMNALVLSCAALDRGYSPRVWGTYRAWAARGGQVRKGEKGTAIVVWKATRNTPPWEPQEGDAGDEQPHRARLFARAFWVFNAAQIDGIDVEEYADQPRPIGDLLAPDWRVPQALQMMGVPVHWGGDRAFYRIQHDEIHMPDRRLFTEARDITSVLAHEAIHATGHVKRLGREFGKRFGDRAYAVEELVAELGAAMALGHWGYAITERPDHAHYIASWLEVLRADAKAILTVASAAQKAADYLLEAAGVRTDDTPAVQPEEIQA